MHDWNFAGRLLTRLGPASHLLDAATGESLSASETRSWISSCATLFQHSGLKAGDRVLISCALSPASSLAWLGAMYAGLVPVPLENRALNDLGPKLLAKTGALAVWSESSEAPDWVVAKKACHLCYQQVKKSDGGNPAVVRDRDDLAALMPTSGSTGVPRLVAVTHGNFLANTEAIVRSQNLTAHERAMLILPISYCFGTSILHSHLYQGGGVIFDRRFTFPDKVLHAMNTHGCTTFAGVPTVYNALLRRSSIRSIPLHGLRRFLQAGGPLSPAAITEMRSITPNTDFYVMYGQTEATARITCLEPGRLCDKLGSVGRPLDNLAVRIISEGGVEVPVGEQGEITVSGPSICAGYFDEPEASARVFQDGWLHTGDIGRVDAEGFIWIVGRKGDFLKIRGLRVSFGEIETRVAAVPGVYECAAVAVPDPEAGEALALFIVPQRGASDVLENVRKNLPYYWTCTSLNLVRELPKTANGKICRNELKPIK